MHWEIILPEAVVIADNQKSTAIIESIIESKVQSMVQSRVLSAGFVVSRHECTTQSGIQNDKLEVTLESLKTESKFSMTVQMCSGE